MVGPCRAIFMAIYNLGSINTDIFYTLDAYPRAGETVAARARIVGLGGKGANQSVAAVRAGSRVTHMGRVGPDGVWAVEMMGSYGVEVAHVQRDAQAPTGHAVIMLDPAGENRIVFYPGTNRLVQEDEVCAVLSRAASGDTLMLQNETNGQVAAARTAQGRGMRVIYSAAPFDVDAVREVLPHVTLLAVNAVEATQLQEAVARPLADLDVPEVVVTDGAAGATWHDLRTGVRHHHGPPRVCPVDTTGAGDVFVGFFAAGRDRGYPVEGALRVSVGAGALHVTRQGTAEAIPDVLEVKTFLSAAEGA